MAIERRPEVSGSTYAFACIHDKDLKTNNPTYFQELLDYRIIRAVELGVKKGEYWGMEKIMNWTKALCGESMQVLKEAEHPVFGKVFFFVIDFIKYVEES